jgi:SanA protein
MMRRRKTLIALIVLLVAVVFLASVHGRVHAFDDRIIGAPEVFDTSQWPRPRVAIVFGASVFSSGELSPTLEDRVESAIELYRSGRVDRILVSGDNRHPSYNEPKAMQDYLVSHAVDPKDVIVDYAGRSTYDTCLRAREIFGIQKAVLVTQRFHLSRALYLANQLGLDAYGVATDGAASSRSLGYQSVRELGAEVKAFLNLYVIPPNTILGEKLPIK